MDAPAQPCDGAGAKGQHSAVFPEKGDDEDEAGNKEEDRAEHGPKMPDAGNAKPDG